MPALIVGTGSFAVLTERDLAEARARGRAPDTPAGAIAHPVPGLRVVPPDVSILEAARLMQSREVAVVDPADAGHGPTRLSVRSGS